MKTVTIRIPTHIILAVLCAALAAASTAGFFECEAHKRAWDQGFWPLLALLPLWVLLVVIVIEWDKALDTDGS
jgi:hypothetical protein